MYYKLLILPCFILFIGCNNREKAGSKVSGPPANIASAPATAEVEPFKEFTPLWEYYTKHIKLNEDFVGYDKDHKQISKENFLKILSTGKYQPILINPADSIRYQLKNSPPGAESSIANYMKTFANEQLVFYHMEGKPVPLFNFVTLTGDRYTSENTKGKIVLFKCWFITCHACVLEMPALNAMVKSYQDRKDIVFLSLAIDKEAPLKQFLKTTRFDYQTVAQQQRYMLGKLKVNTFPTHFLIDKAGRVVKVSNSGEEIEMFLKRMLAEQ